MARGIMYEITSETELENAGIFSLSEDDLLDFVGNLACKWHQFSWDFNHHYSWSHPGY